jgi:hypothetical protein
MLDLSQVNYSEKKQRKALKLEAAAKRQRVSYAVLPAAAAVAPVRWFPWRLLTPRASFTAQVDMIVLNCNATDVDCKREVFSRCSPWCVCQNLEVPICEEIVTLMLRNRKECNDSNLENPLRILPILTLY